MKNMRVPTRPPPPVPQQQNKLFPVKGSNYQKKKPPPRPPPPNFSKMKSKSAWNLNQHFDGLSLIDLTPPQSPAAFNANRNRAFGGSLSSSFSNSTSSLASSKKSFELDNNFFDTWSLQSNSASQSPVYSTFVEKVNIKPTLQVPSMPTIIRAQPSKVSTSDFGKKNLTTSDSPPMPNVPPPSPPKESVEVNTPYAIALYNYPAPYDGDLELEVDDIIILLKKIDKEWYYGRIGDKEGMFPANFVDVQVPLEEANNNAVALYQFTPELPGDLGLYPGQAVKVLGRISQEWLIGESNGQRGQFPANFIDKVPPNI